MENLVYGIMSINNEFQKTLIIILNILIFIIKDDKLLIYLFADVV